MKLVSRLEFGSGAVAMRLRAGGEHLVIAATVEGDVDRITKRPHRATVPPAPDIRGPLPKDIERARSAHGATADATQLR